MKSDKINPEIKSIIEQYTGSIGAWGPKEIYVDIGDRNFTKDLVQVMKSKGWYLDEEESDDKNLFFHLGFQEKVIEDKIPLSNEANFSNKDAWSSSFLQKVIICVLIALFCFLFFKIWSNPRIMTFRYPFIYRSIVSAFFMLIIYRFLKIISWKLKINGTDIVIRRFFQNDIIPIDQIKRIKNEKSQYWARDIIIHLKEGKEIVFQGLNSADAIDLASKLNALKVSLK
jgi:hypothetical protein